MVAVAERLYGWGMNKTAHEQEPRKTILVTGASSGIGRLTAEGLVAAGHRVYGTSRAPDAAGPAGVRMLTLDVEDEGSVHGCVGMVLAEAGHLDVLINNAGRMVHGLLDDVPLVEAQRMFETNFWGAARMVSAVLPGMRERGCGQVLMVGSPSNWVTVPMNGFYSASKAALARYTEALRHETMHWGIRVSLVEPSDVASSIWSRARKYPARLPGNAPLAERVVSALQSLLDVAPPPTEVARLMVRLVDEKSPASVYRVGSLARRMPWLRVLMPARFFERGLRKRFGIEGISANSQGPGRGCRPR